MHILFVTTKIDFQRAGGSVPDLDCKVRDMQLRGADVRVLTVFSELNQSPLDVPYSVEEERVTNKSLPWSQWRVFCFLRAHARDADVVHVEGQFAYAAAAYRLQGGKPVVAFYNREMLVWEKNNSLRRITRSFLEKFFYRVLVPCIDHFIFTTPFLYEEYRRFGLRVPKERVSIMVDFFDPSAMRAVVKERSESALGWPLLVFASGRMIEQKGFHLLVEAVSLLPDDIRSHIHVTIGGDGPERQRLIELGSHKNVSHQISFPGWISKEDFWKTLARADIFVLPRWRIEQPSVVVMEALSLGTPCIVPAAGGVEWMAAGAVATLTDSDVTSLSHTLESVVRSKDKRTELSRKALKRWEVLDHHHRADELWNILKNTAHRSRSEKP